MYYYMVIMLSLMLEVTAFMFIKFIITVENVVYSNSPNLLWL